jgi:hypothetical protein
MEPWRQELLAMGYDGMSLKTKDLSGQLELPSEVRELIYARMGDTKPYQAAQKLLKEPKYQDEIKYIKDARRRGVTSNELRNQDLEIWRQLDNVVTTSYKLAENAVIAENKNVREYIEFGKQSRALARIGDKAGAETLQEKMKPLLEMIK